MRNKILFFILLTFCLGLSAQHRMVNTAVTEQTGKKVSKLLKTNHRMLNPISPPGVYIADPEARQMPDGRVYGVSLRKVMVHSMVITKIRVCCMTNGKIREI